jgi:hypothetical protein
MQEHAQGRHHGPCSGNLLKKFKMTDASERAGELAWNSAKGLHNVTFEQWY